MSDIFELQADLSKTPSQHSGRYYGFLSGVVTNAVDSQGLCRIKARIGAMGDKEETDWLIPAFPGSIECIPTKGDPCIVGFLDGDPNRGFWLYHPESTTKARPTEAMVLGTTAWGIINYLVDQFNQLRSDFNQHAHNPGTFTTPSGPVTLLSGPPSLIAGTVAGTIGQTTAAAANKGQASDGSNVPNVSTSKKVLSGLCKVK